MKIRQTLDMVFDSNNERTILFGGIDYGSNPINDTWIYNYTDNTWYNASPTFSGGTLYARHQHGMVFDSNTNKIILFGGTDG